MHSHMHTHVYTHARIHARTHARMHTHTCTHARTHKHLYTNHTSLACYSLLPACRYNCGAYTNIAAGWK